MQTLKCTVSSQKVGTGEGVGVKVGVWVAVGVSLGKIVPVGVIEGVNVIVGVGVMVGVLYRDWETDRKSTRLNSSHSAKSRMPSSA